MVEENSTEPIGRQKLPKPKDREELLNFLAGGVQTDHPLGRPVRGKDFLGREEEIKEVLGLVKDKKSLHILGGLRSGKTSVLRKLEELIPITIPEFNTLYMDAEGMESAEEMVTDALDEHKERFNPQEDLVILVDEVTTHLTEVKGINNLKRVISEGVNVPEDKLVVITSGPQSLNELKTQVNLNWLPGQEIELEPFIPADLYQKATGQTPAAIDNSDNPLG